MGRKLSSSSESASTLKASVLSFKASSIGGTSSSTSELFLGEGVFIWYPL